MYSRPAGRRGVRVGAAVAAVLLGIGVLTGCGGQNPEPQKENTSENEDPQRAKGGEPEDEKEWKDESDKTEEYVFVEEYVQALNEVRKGGDSSTLLGMSTGDCASCDEFAQYHEQVYADGGEYTADPSVQLVQQVPPPGGMDQDQDDSGPIIVRVLAEHPKVAVVEKSGGPELTQDSGSLMYDFELAGEQNAWKVAAFCQVDEGQLPGCSSG